MDNLNAEGYSMRFGLYYVNYENQERTLRDMEKFTNKLFLQINRNLMVLHQQTRN